MTTLTPDPIEAPLAYAAVQFRAKAADARLELADCTDPELRLYLTARANQADSEAAAMERWCN